MSFDIAIYNAGCKNSDQVINSVKAAYLYGDKVRVYDYEATNEDDCNDKIRKAAEWWSNNEQIKDVREIYPELNSIGYKLQDIEKLATFLEKKLEESESKYRYDEIANRLESLGPEPQLTEDGFEHLTERYIEDIKRIHEETLKQLGFTQKEYIDFIIELLQGRAVLQALNTCQIAAMFLNYYYVCEVVTNSRIQHNNKIERYRSSLHRIKADLIIPEVSLDRGTLDLLQFEDRFLDDKGFKVINGPVTISKQQTTFSSMWVPSYLAEYSISSLPGFEEASVDEIIDIRKELNKHIIPYRSAMLRMAQEIKEIPDSESFQRECMAIYLREIEPQVVSINEAINDNNVFKNIAKTVFTDEKTWVSLGALSAAFITSGDIANALSIGTAIAFGGFSIAKSIVSTLEEKKKIRDNEMFFLYEAGKRLKK